MKEMGPPESPTVFESEEHEQAHRELMRLLLTIDPELCDTDLRVIAARAKLREFEKEGDGMLAADAAGE